MDLKWTRVEAPSKQSNLLIVCTHHFGGNQKYLKNNVRVFNELGYDSLTFDFETPPNEFSGLKEWIKLMWRRNLYSKWSEQIINTMNLTNEPKVIFSQSFSGLTAINAMAQVEFKNIHGFIGDGGPFLSLPQCLWNLYTHAYPIPLFLRPWICLASLTLLGRKIGKVTHRQLNKFPKDFPVLSIRAERDQLIHPKAIDKVFAPHPQIDIQKVSFKNSNHLHPIKDHPEKYKEVLRQFLEPISNGIKQIERGYENG